MATRSEAKQAFWDASKKDDAARKALVKFLEEKSEDAPGGFVKDEDLEGALKGLKGRRK